MIAAVASLTACNRQAEAPKPADSGTASGTMANIPITAQMKHGMAAHTVRAIDHGDMTGLGWSAITIGFSVRPDQLSGLKVRDKVDFEIDWDGKAGTLTKIAKIGFLRLG